ncbi:right-handed parallel beta-helix repeat-containing protein [Streptomyces sp. NPDC007264]|uniref:right-handed parallel beta-helix repeat-containing protein n=1 Tax=Streptomyces sp. NPDC007264 TaxID=3364777 RepID=UPI0036D7F9C3
MRRIPMLRASAGTAALAAGITAVPIPAVAAAPVTHVRCSADALTAAISRANNEGGVLDLAPRCRYVLTEASSDTVGLPPISNTIVIHGHDATIARSEGSINFRIFYVENSGNLQLQNLTITKGDANGGGAPAFSSGGGIYSAGHLGLEHVTVTGNTAGRGGGGGVTIAENGTASIEQSKISGNTTTGVAGGLAAEGRSTTVTDSRITFNTADAGGGILNSGGSLTLKKADVRGNNAQDYGGGIVNLGVGPNTGSLRMYNSEVRFNNVLGVGLGVFSGGGGLFNFSGGAVRAEDSSVSNNTSEGSGTSAGGIRNFATLQLTRTKVMDNRSLAAPGGIDNGNTPASTVSLVDSDVRNNNDTNCEGSAGPVPGCQG